VAGPAAAADQPRLEEPSLHLPASAPGVTRVALTFDACDGKVDRRILDLLEQKSIPATIFVSGKWLARNAATFAELRAHPALFEIEDHGARHIPAVDYPTAIYGLKAAGSPAAVAAEVQGGAAAITAAGGATPLWFRGAAAKYDASAMAQIRGLGFQVAGFSLNGDSGATASTAEAARRIGRAKDGDVIISHINQPGRPAGAGVAAGIAALQARGVVFVRLNDALPPPDTAAGPG
jgi:peptidoglycan/xylan/chitin deacetylase (PgdA/CDA1 family)